MREAQKHDAPFTDAPKASPFRLWLLIGLAFAASFLMIRRFNPGPTAGGQADFRWVLSDLEGKPVELSAYAGRPIFLNIWATWCPPCQEEMPSIARLASNPKLSKVAFLCVSIEETADPVKRYVASKKPPMTMLMSNGEPPPVFPSRSVPSTFLIAPDGRIVRAEVGGQDWDRPEVVTMLEELAREAK